MNLWGKETRRDAGFWVVVECTLLDDCPADEGGRENTRSSTHRTSNVRDGDSALNANRTIKKKKSACSFQFPLRGALVLAYAVSGQGGQMEPRVAILATFKDDYAETTL